MSGSLFSPAASTPAADAGSSPPADNRPAPQPDVTLPRNTSADQGLPDVLMTPEEQALVGQQQGQQPAQAPAQEGAPAEPQGQDLDTNPARQAPPGFVPAGALAEARAELKQQRQTVQRLEQQLQTLLSAAAARGLNLTGEQPQQPPIPDVEVDPVGHFRARTEMLERQLQQMMQGVGQMTQAQQQQQQMQRLMEMAQVQVHQFAAQNPDYHQAYQYWFNSLQREAQEAGYSPQEAYDFALQQERAVAIRALQQEANPGVRIMAMAKARGWRPPQAPQPNQQPAGYQPPPVDPNAAFAALERGAAASRSVGTNGVPGLPPSGLTAERIAQMPLADFEKATEGDAWERLWRGGMA